MIDKHIHHCSSCHDGITMASSLYPYHDDLPYYASPDAVKIFLPLLPAPPVPPIISYSMTPYGLIQL